MNAPVLSTPPETPPWKRWLVLSPAARILIFVAVLGALIFLLRIAFVGIGWASPGSPVPQRHIAMVVVQIVPAVLAYLFLVRVIERRWPAELAWEKLLPDGALGFIAGGLLVSAVIGLLWQLGSYEITGFNPEPNWVRQLMIGGFGAAIAEEIITRGVLFRVLEEGLGTWAALLISAALFGLGHLGNNGATVWSAAAVALEAGLLFGLLFHITRSLPLCIGVHMGWNFTQGAVWGVPVSGVQDTGWLVSVRPGPVWLSGGHFGAEASVVAVALCSVVTLWLLQLALRRGSIVPPWFARGRAAAAPGVANDNVQDKAATTC